MWLGFICTCLSISMALGAPPVFTGTYPATADRNESEAMPAGTLFHTFTVTDADGTLPIMSYTFDPPEGQYIFAFPETNITDGTQVNVTLATSQVFDFETQPVYKIYANAFDGVQYAQDPVLFTINVLDVGEGPVLVPFITTQAFFMNESEAGYHIGDPSYTISDGDNAETHTWSILGDGSPYLNVISTNGSLFLKSDYDLENSAPTSLTVNISVTDRYELPTNLTYSLTVYDVNDNAPVFNQTLYNIDVNTSTAVGAELTTFTVTDADLTATNNMYNYSLEKTGIADYFIVEDHKLKLQFMFDILNGNGPYSFEIYAIDTGSPALTGTATVSLTITQELGTTESTTAAVTAGYDYGNESSTIILTISASFLAACIIGYTMVLCWRWNTFGECLPRSPNNGDCHHDVKDEQFIYGNSFPTPYLVGEKKGTLDFEEKWSKDRAIY